ncbi:MAG: amidase [Chloroflexota bacterium]
MDDLVFLTVRHLARLIRERQSSAVEVLEAHLRHIAQHNVKLNAIVTLDEEGARRRAQAADAALARGEIWGPLHGIPVTIKDSFETLGLRTTSSHPPLSNYIPKQDATPVARWRAAGAIILGKTNLPELAGDAQTDSPIFGRTNNPWNLDCTPGGSTGGGAAAVAAGLSPLELGSDIGGSIRIPSHFCGIFGLKPTEHRVSSAGHIPDLPGQVRGVRHLGTFGPLARSVEDLRLGFALMAGPDGRDWEIPPVPLDTPDPKPLRERRFAWTDDFGGAPVTVETRAAMENVAARLAALGCRVERCSPPGFSIEVAWGAYGAIFGSEAGLGMSPMIRRMATLLAPFLPKDDRITHAIVRGFRLKVEPYLAALARRDELITSLENFLGEWDAWLCPVSATPAFTHRKVTRTSPPPAIRVDDRSVPYWTACVAHTSVFNLTGHPVVVCPIARSTDDLPIGIQVVGRRWCEMELLNVAESLTEVTGEFQPPPGY